MPARRVLAVNGFIGLGRPPPRPCLAPSPPRRTASARSCRPKHRLRCEHRHVHAGRIPIGLSSLRARCQLGPRFRPLRLVRRLPFRPVPFQDNLGARQASDNPKHQQTVTDVRFRDIRSAMNQGRHRQIQYSACLQNLLAQCAHVLPFVLQLCLPDSLPARRPTRMRSLP